MWSTNFFKAIVNSFNILLRFKNSCFPVIIYFAHGSVDTTDPTFHRMKSSEDKDQKFFAGIIKISLKSSIKKNWFLLNLGSQDHNGSRNNI